MSKYSQERDFLREIKRKFGRTKEQPISVVQNQPDSPFVKNVYPLTKETVLQLCPGDIIENFPLSKLPKDAIYHYCKDESLQVLTPLNIKHIQNAIMIRNIELGSILESTINLRVQKLAHPVLTENDNSTILVEFDVQFLPSVARGILGSFVGNPLTEPDNFESKEYTSTIRFALPIDHIVRK